jgi:antirestriction protein ArdC
MANTNNTQGTKMTVAEIFTREAERVAGLTHNVGKQVNGVSGREYQGFNKINLYLVAKEKGFESKEWLTHDQLKNQGLTIKAEQHGTPVFNHKLVDTEDGKKKKLLRYYLVFNRDQLELSKELQEEAEAAV